MVACGHFFCNDFFIGIEKCDYAEVIREDIFNALSNESLELENGIILQVAEDFEDIPVENFLGLIESLAHDFDKVFNEGKKFGLNLKIDDKSVLELFTKEDLSDEIHRRESTAFMMPNPNDHSIL
jgi:hypothetical protein